ncbi:MAG: c-type cytochrome [Campylobacterota bacterium]|nr:c-type cytochrome [Campylobacterota bacterium]
MKKLNLVLLSVGAALALSGCGEIGAEGQPITYAKKPADVYKASCASCHGAKGEGNAEKKAPALAGKQAGELEAMIYDANNNAADVKEHIRKGVFDARAMSKYLEQSFYTPPPKVAPTPEPTPEPVVEEAPAKTPATDGAPAEAPAADAAPAAEVAN